MTSSFLSTKIFSLSLIFIFLFSSYVKGQDRGLARVMFYNVENLFDTFDDPITTDEEFLPDGDRHWTDFRLNQKLKKIAKVIIATGGWEVPEIIGLCEVENRGVLEQLITNTQLKKYGYQIVHKDSPDRRGIDVALFYRSDAIEPLNYEYLKVSSPKDKEFRTRDILYFSGIVKGIDTLHLFVNHWPSRYGGLLETVEKRALAAKALKQKVQSLQEEFETPKIVIIGDFNDQPTDKSLVEELESLTGNGPFEDNQLINLSYPWMGASKGTLKYRSQWSVFDHVIVSGSILNSSDGIGCSKKDAHIFRIPFLLMEDKTHGGNKPNRTYIGYRYNGGFSDHFPIHLDLFKN